MKKYKICDIAEIVNGSTPSTEISEYWGDDFVWITPNDLSNQNCKYVCSGDRKLSKLGFDEANLTLLPVGSILLTSRAPIGLISINTCECCTNQGFKSLIVDGSECDSEYLYYYLLIHMDEIRALGSGTTFMEVSKNALSEYEVNLPDIKEQRKIANVLSCIDDKIIVNKNINTSLEILARTIYDYWFLQFNYPDKNGLSYKENGGKMIWCEDLKREIPIEGFVVTLNDIINENPKSQIQVSMAKSTLGDYPFFTSGDSVFEWDEYFVDGRNCFLNTGGNGGLKYYIGKAAYSTDTWCITADDNKADYLYLTLSAIEPYLDYKFFQGTGLKHLQKTLFKSEKIYVPSDVVLADFNEITHPIFNLISNNAKQNKQLERLRNFLLPLLINGQVNIKE